MIPNRNSSTNEPHTEPAITGKVTAAAAGTSDSRQSPAAGRRISHYRIERKLGAGGMGQVFLATDIALGRSAALKILPDTFSTALRQRLFREAWASARLQHPAIATFFEAGEVDGVTFIAMEYVAGHTLQQEIAAGPICVDRALPLVCCVLEALTHAHAAEILHRDIKPANIMCTDDGAAKLLDFGLAKHLLAGGEPSPDASSLGPMGTSNDTEVALEDTIQLSAAEVAKVSAQLSDSHGNLTNYGTVLGTLGYMSPEQLCGGPVDACSDVFALAAVLYEMLTGRPAFPGATANERIAAVLQHTPPPLAVGEPSSQLNAILRQALCKNPAERTPSAKAFLAELRALVDEQAFVALPNTIAVVDFDNESADDTLDWLSSGVADSLSTYLQSIPNVDVVPRQKVASVQQTVFGRPIELGLHLGCRWVVSGATRRSADKVQMEARLIDVPTSTTRWERTVEGPRHQILQLQGDLENHLASALQPGFSFENPRRCGLSVEAYECYVRGRRELFTYGKGSFDRGFELFSRALELSPDYALAKSGLAQICGMRFTFSNDPQTLHTAIAFAEQAIEMDPQLADPWIWLGYAHAQLAFSLFDGSSSRETDEKLAEADRAMRRALELDPSNPMAPYFAAGSMAASCCVAGDPAERQRRREAALKLWQQALRSSPNSCFTLLGTGWAHLDLGHHVEARWCLEKAVELEPKVTPPTPGVAVFLGECLRRIGDLQGARKECLRGLEAAEQTDHMYRDTFRGVGLCALGRTMLQLDAEDGARAAFHQAVLHLRGRQRARIGGHLLVQALAGLTRAGEGRAPFQEAGALFEARKDYEFGWLWWGWDEITLLELSRAAERLGRLEDAGRYLDAARQAGSVEAEEQFQGKI